MNDRTELATEIDGDISLDVLRLLTGCALAAVCRQMPQEAQQIVDGLQPRFAAYTAVAMASATVATATGRLNDALRMMDRLATADPHNDAIACACAMLKRELGMPGWRALAQRVVDSDTDAQAVSLAEDMLGTTPPSARPPQVLGPEGLRFA
jgi:Bacterial type III secretion protein (HrpB1_HrpK)